MQVLAKIAYWLAVLIVSVIVLILLVRWFEGRDESGLEVRLPPVPGRSAG